MVHMKDILSLVAIARHLGDDGLADPFSPWHGEDD
jgi:hypothetical protein